MNSPSPSVESNGDDDDSCAYGEQPDSPSVNVEQTTGCQPTVEELKLKDVYALMMATTTTTTA
jgi:hypothetical protein